MEYKLIYTNENKSVRIYSLPRKVKYYTSWGEKRDIRERLVDMKLKPEFEISEDAITEGIDMIAVSDAHTHAERLAFPAFYCLNKETREKHINWDFTQMSGRMTMMIHGGSYSSFKEDKVYIRHILFMDHIFSKEQSK